MIGLTAEFLNVSWKLTVFSLRVPLAEPLGSAEPRLKNIVVASIMTFNVLLSKFFSSFFQHNSAIQNINIMSSIVKGKR